MTSSHSPMTGVMIMALVMLVSGCAIGPGHHLPSTWVSQPQAIRATIKPVQQARLQVYITDNHTALRLVSPTDPEIFWDPGGRYGLVDDDLESPYAPLSKGIERSKDLIVSNPPNMETFVRWRWIVEDHHVEVFEWDLPDLDVQMVREVLLNGTDDTHPAGSFSTWTFPLFCAMATSDFLGRFVSPMIQLPERYFLPNNLAQALYVQAPSRVRVFTSDGGKAVYVPPGPTSVRQ